MCALRGFECGLCLLRAKETAAMGPWEWEGCNPAHMQQSTRQGQEADGQKNINRLQTADICRLQTVRWRFNSQTSPEILTLLISVLISSIKNPPRQPALIWETGNQHQKRGRERTSSSFTRLEGGGFDDWG